MLMIKPRPFVSIRVLSPSAEAVTIKDLVDIYFLNLKGFGEFPPRRWSYTFTVTWLRTHDPALPKLCGDAPPSAPSRVRDP